MEARCCNMKDPKRTVCVIRNNIEDDNLISYDVCTLNDLKDVIHHMNLVEKKQKKLTWVSKKINIKRKEW